jgi:hypothetical protein
MQRDSGGQQKGGDAAHNLDQTACGASAFAGRQSHNHGITQQENTFANV